MSCVPGGCLASISTPTIWPPVSWTVRATRSASPTTIDVDTAGLAASRRDGRVRAAITALLDHAQQQNCSAVVVENLDFADARATGRETLGRGQRGKRFRRAVAGIPTAKFRTRLTAMAARRGVAVIGVDAAYTSQLGQPILENPLTAADFRSGHPPSRRGGRDRQTWPRLGDQATAGRTPQRTEDRCGHSTGQAQSSTEPRWRARPFRPTDMHTPRRAGPPENTRPPRPTPFGPHRTHSCSLIRNGGERSPISTAAAGMVTMASTTSHRIPAPATCRRCTHGRASSYGVSTEQTCPPCQFSR